jgi:hypothetical protein
MVVEASFVGLIKTTLIVIGAMVVVKFIGQLMIAKRNINEQNRMKQAEFHLRKEKEQYEKNKGKISILRKDTIRNVQDVDFEDIS